MARPRVILAVDRPGWAFHAIARQLVKHLSSEFNFQVVPADLLRSAECDIAVVLWWRAHPIVTRNCYAKAVVTCLYDHVTWCKHPQDILDWEEACGKSDVVVVANQTLLEQLRSADAITRPTFLCEDGVDCERFTPKPFPEEFTVGWCGDSSAGYGKIKGVAAIVEACELAGAKLIMADKGRGTQVPFDEMPDWYGRISTYVCASSAEGTPNPPLEAMASGRPVITTRVGVMPRAVQIGASGYFVERDSHSIAMGIEAIRASNLEQMGRAARLSAEAHDWSHKIPAWRAALHAALDAATSKRPAVRKAVKTGTKPKVLAVADVRGWAFDINEQDMAAHCRHAFDFDHWYVGDQGIPPSMRQYHAVFSPFHRWAIEQYWEGVPLLGSLRSDNFDPDHPGELPMLDRIFVDRCLGFHVVTQRAMKLWGPTFPQMIYLTNPVNMTRFQQATEVDRVVACWNGNAGHHSSRTNRDVKGFHSVIKQAVGLAQVPFNLAEYQTCRLVPEDMPEWYRRSSVALCASAYEGASNSVMEAMASGLAVIATDVGNHREMMESEQKHLGDSGIMLVERTPEAFGEALRSLTPARVREMGRINREEIAARWSWGAWTDRYVDFIRMAVGQ